MARKYTIPEAGIATLEELRMRCYCDQRTGCWHYRSRSKRPIDGQWKAEVHVRGHGMMMVARAALVLSTGKPMNPRMVAMRLCDSHDCCNPQHREIVLRRTVAKANAPGVTRPLTALQIAALRESTRRQTVVTPELLRWARESRQSIVEMALALGVSHQHLSRLLREPVAVASVFHLPAAMRAAA